MSLDLQGIVDAVQSHALAAGWFTSVNGHEPKNAPGTGIHAAVWLQRMTAQPRRSGLNAVSVRLELTLRIYSNMLAEDQDRIDPDALAAADALCAAYSGDFTLGGTVAEVDLLGAYGVGLDVRAGYLNHSGVMYRVLDITLPLILNDVWTEAP